MVPSLVDYMPQHIDNHFAHVCTRTCAHTQGRGYGECPSGAAGVSDHQAVIAVSAAGEGADQWHATLSRRSECWRTYSSWAAWSPCACGYKYAPLTGQSRTWLPRESGQLEPTSSASADIDTTGHGPAPSSQSRVRLCTPSVSATLPASRGTESPRPSGSPLGTRRSMRNGWTSPSARFWNGGGHTSPDLGARTTYLQASCFRGTPAQHQSACANWSATPPAHTSHGTRGNASVLQPTCGLAAPRTGSSYGRDGGRPSRRAVTPGTPHPEPYPRLCAS